MSKNYLMTEAHYHELEEALMPEHTEAIFAYSYDLYRNGYNEGIRDTCIVIGIGVLGWLAFDVCCKLYEKHKANKTE